MNDLARGEVPSWKEYSLENKEVQDWVVWEALTHESVLRSKDASVLGVIRYKPFERKEGAGISLPAFSQGWVMNIEEQHGEAGEACFLALTWNPFLSLKGDKVENALGGNAAMSLDAMEQHMFSVLDTLASRFPPEAEAKILKYQEIINYLAGHLRQRALQREVDRGKRTRRSRISERRRGSAMNELLVLLYLIILGAVIHIVLRSLQRRQSK